MEKVTKSIQLVSIVGAGPGDPELLTVKALNRIKSAEVILHDNLVPDSIIDFKSSSAQLVNVGRFYGDPQDQQERQDRINSLMGQYSSEGKSVVRLKSGDSFIFGRAIEEIRYLVENNIPFEVIPGITAGIAAANLCHIPLTERSRSNAVVFCTGHTASYDYEQLEALGNMLKTGSTLVMYMGLKSLREVVERLKRISMDDAVQISAISHVSLSSQKSITGTLDDIESKIAKEDLPMPVIFIIGKYACPVS